MDDLFNLAAMAPSPVPPLRYCCAALPDLVELAFVRGCDVALPVHFHDEDQITFVVSGRRRFQIDGRCVSVAPGHGIFIAAGTPHRSLDEPDGVLGFNVYVGAGGAHGGLVAAMTRRWRATGCLPLTDLAAMVRAPDPQGSVPQPAAGPHLDASTVRKAATSAGLSREAFSRAFRRAHGIAPSVARSLMRLNTARRLLRAGAPLAAVAAEAGFADQSHLGRCFRRAFGVTPGRYQAGWQRSHSFQTEPRRDD